MQLLKAKILRIDKNFYVYCEFEFLRVCVCVYGIAMSE